MNRFGPRVLAPLLGALCILVTLLVGTGTIQAKPTLTIVSSFYPVYIDLLNITAGVKDVAVVNMTGSVTGCLHDYQLTPTDMRKLESAKAFVVNGSGMEAFMDKVVKRLPRLKVINASKGITSIKNTSDGESNPHVWVSISNAILQVKNIGDSLAKVDSAHADQYRANTANYVRKLEAQRTKMHRALDSVNHRYIVTLHEAFPYFVKEFNLETIAVIEREPGSEPSAAELARTIDAVKKARCKALFAEPQYPAKAAETVARETGARLYTLDPAVTGPLKADAYIHIMDENLRTLQKALK